ncbi:MAG: DNA cytosine methyltransferase [Desulfomonile tiedjei]|nr:DNA cytosine methyltransferase [Desulfomonile tiedjei]
MRAIDFFCGGGGLTRGLLDAGIKVVAGVDSDESCRATYEFNNPGARFIAKDLRDVTLDELRGVTHSKSFKDMLFVGCAPCQPFSPHRRGEHKLQHGTILGEFGRIVGEAKPGLVLIENVPGILRVSGFSTFRRFVKSIETSGYDYTFDVLDAKYYGVPQARRRLVLIAALGLKATLPKPKFGPLLHPIRTVRQAISHFPSIEAGEAHPEIPNHCATSLTPLNLERLRHTPRDGGDRRSWPTHLRLDCHKGDHEGHTDVYGRMRWDAPAPTLTGRCHSLSNGRYGHPEQDRAISLREAAALQTFPDRYVFFGPNKHIAQQIGNAVPVRLAEEIGKHLRLIWGE